MRSRLSVLIALFLCLWLPLQGFAAPLMPYCRHHQEQQATETAMAGCHGQHADSQAPAGLGHDQNCDGCALCHMCSSPAASTFHLTVWADTSPVVDLPVYTVHYPSQDPAHLWRPPRLA